MMWFREQPASQVVVPASGRWCLAEGQGRAPGSVAVWLILGRVAELGAVPVLALDSSLSPTQKDLPLGQGLGLGGRRDAVPWLLCLGLASRDTQPSPTQQRPCTPGTSPDTGRGGGASAAWLPGHITHLAGPSPSLPSCSFSASLRPLRLQPVPHVLVIARALS